MYTPAHPSFTVYEYMTASVSITRACYPDAFPKGHCLVSLGSPSVPWFSHDPFIGGAGHIDYTYQVAFFH